MNRLLIGIGILCIVAAAAVPLIDVHLRPQTPQSADGDDAEGPAGSPAPAARPATSADSVAPVVDLRPAGKQAPPQTPEGRGPQGAPVAMPALGLAIDGPVSFEQATGRSSTLTMPEQRDIEPITVGAVARQGQGVILIRSTLGGIEGQSHHTATWRIDGADAVHFTIDDGTAAIITMTRGRWTVQPADLAFDLRCALTDQARVIHALARAFAVARTVAPDQAVTMAGNSFRLWRRDAQSLLLVGPSVDGPVRGAYPPQDGAWNDLRLYLDAAGRPIAAERLLASPGSPGEPGFLVRRTILRFDPPAARAAGCGTRPHATGDDR